MKEEKKKKNMYGKRYATQQWVLVPCEIMRFWCSIRASDDFRFSDLFYYFSFAHRNHSVGQYMDEQYMSGGVWQCDFDDMKMMKITF